MIRNITIEEAQERLMETSNTLEIRKKKITDCLGAILAEDIIAMVTQPPFPRSAMDGYAVHATDILSATREKPITLPVKMLVCAGDEPTGFFPQGMAAQIMTGAPIPRGADLVIPQEAVDCNEYEVTFYKSGKIHDNCCLRGEDFFQGDILATRGSPVDSYTIAAAVAGGVNQANVYERIRVAVITTGNELIPAGEKLPAGKIYNSSLAYFESRLASLGCEVVFSATIPDEKELIAEAVREAAIHANLILTTGGISVGKKDYLPEVIDSLGANVIFRGIQIKPGMPTMAAIFEERTILCLSGNPYSAIAMFEILYPAYEKKARSRNQMRLYRLESTMINDFHKSSPTRRLVRGILEKNGVFVPKGQQNGQLYAGIGTNCLVDIPAGSAPLMTGEKVELFLLP